MRRPLSSKSNICTESMDVDAAGISGKVSVHYPGISVKKKTEVSRGHSTLPTAGEGLNMKLR